MGDGALLGGARVRSPWLMALTVLALETSCSTTATIFTKRSRMEVTIVAGDDEQLVVANSVGARVVLQRSDIRDIDYPGNVHAVTGGIFGLIGLSNLALFAFGPQGGCSPSGLQGGCIATGLLAAAGGAMFTWGILTWLWSKAASTADLPVGGMLRVLSAPTPAPFQVAPGDAPPPAL